MTNILGGISVVTYELGNHKWSNILKPGDFPVWKTHHFLFPCVVGADDVLVFFGVPCDNLNGSISRFRKNNINSKLPIFEGRTAFLRSQWRPVKYIVLHLYLVPSSKRFIENTSWKICGVDQLPLVPVLVMSYRCTIKNNIKSIRTPLISRLGWVSDYPHYKFRMEPHTSPMFFSPFCWVNLGSPNTVRRFLRSLRECQ